ncbi:MAG TPA: HAMP domain-containing sensor histidine kinase [Bacteroidota bacterium]|nr:HAMP domain-containing sensor histidine kinase [Bacteroidota bacterium]
MFRNLKLSSKLLFTFVPLFILLIVDDYYLDIRGQEDAMLNQAKASAFEKAHIVRVSLVEQMLENEKVDDVLLDNLRKVGGLEDLYIRIRPDNLHLRDWLQDSTRDARLMKRMQYAMAKGDIGNEVFDSGNSLFVNREDNIEAIIPFKAEKKCQTCHDVPINHVLGVAHIQVPLKEIKASISANAQRTAVITLGFAVLTLVIGIFFYRSLIQKPVRNLLAATEAIGQGNLSYEMNVSTSSDELGILSQSFDRMRKTLRQSQEALRNSTVGQIANSLIRDFRAPMRQILTSVDRIERGNPADDVKAQLCATARNSVVDMNKMAQDLLDYTTGDLKVNKRPCNVPGVLTYVADAVRQDLERDMVKLEVQQGYQGNIPLDYERIARAFINIVSYSVNYIPPGGMIRLAAAAQEKMVVFRISDNGNGIPAQFRDKIFEPFTRFVQEKGLGLSLALAKRIIEAQGGTILVESEEGKGTSFTISMPQA